MTEVLPPSKVETNPKSKSDVNLIILHVGTNDASIGRIDEKIMTICGSIKKGNSYADNCTLNLYLSDGVFARYLSPCTNSLLINIETF